MMFAKRVLIAHLLLQPLVLPALVDLRSVARSRMPSRPVGIEIRLLEEEERAGLAGFERARDGALRR